MDTLKFILSIYWNKCRINLIVLIFLNFINSLIPIISIHLFQKLIEEIMNFMQDDGSLKMLIFIFTLQIISNIIPFIGNHILNINDQIIDNKLSLETTSSMLQKVKSLDYLDFENPSFYDSFQRVSSNTSNIIESVNHLIGLISNLISAISVLVYLLTINWIVVFIIILGIVPYTLTSIKFNRRNFSLINELMPATRKEQYFINLLTNRNTLKEIILFNAFNFLELNWKKQFLLLAEKKLNFIKTKSKTLFSAELIILLTFTLSGLVIIIDFKNSNMAADLVATIQSIQLFQTNLNNIAKSYSDFKGTLIFIEDYMKFIHINPRNEVKLNKIEKLHRLEVKNLWFRYPHNNFDTLKGISFNINPGKKIAIVGENGSGKTTLIKCIAGLYSKENLPIFINGIPIKEVDIESLQDRMSVLFQDFISYELTVRENIGISSSSNMDDNIRLQNVAEKVNLLEIINKLPNRFDSLLGRYFEGGNELSGGQWQKIALGRALFRESDLIILDEPTAALDPVSEKEILEDILNECDKSIIIVTHRLGVASLADEILVMKDGQIVESGTHNELLSLNGEYKKMYESQSHWYNLQKGVLI
ncbi:ATP-binding cassette domain-containing protein [Geobacillus thermoleovorans]|uniref:ABC transporter ATP-binding protein n=3 Tax=Geobacillus TaxID=129337 RepID=UPI00205F12A0|nr:ABC transporter ATP-binding protein [Geobacillus thermoleovorans]UPT58214.1 ATP-binding cassette domain-containing protein [Geobacillus thermoleovorans]